MDPGRLTAMRPSGYYATYRGIDYAVGSYGRDPDGEEYVNLIVDSADAERFGDVTTGAGGHLQAKVLRADLDRYDRVETTGTYDGKTVVIWGDGDPVPVTFVGDPQWAEAHGFAGSQHDGWHGEVALTELSDIREMLHALP